MPNYLPKLRKAICPVGVLLLALSPFASACAEEGEESTARALKLSETSRFANFATSSVSVGVRWDVRENMALKLQYDRFKTPSLYRHGFCTA